MRSPSTLTHPDRREAGTWLDRVCEWLVAHPRITCAVICAMPLIAGLLERPH